MKTIFRLITFFLTWFMHIYRNDIMQRPLSMETREQNSTITQIVVVRKYGTDLNAGDNTLVKDKTGKAMPCFISPTTAHAPFFAGQKSR